MKINLVILCLLCSTVIVNAQLDDLPKNKEPGKCYAKVLIPNATENESVTHPIYIGEDAHAEFVQTIAITLRKGFSGWQKRSIAGRKEQVWCMVDVKPIIEEVVIVTDTTKNKAFMLKTFQIDHNNKGGEHIEWREVVCKKDLNKSVVRDMRCN